MPPPQLPQQQAASQPTPMAQQPTPASTPRTVTFSLPPSSRQARSTTVSPESHASGASPASSLAPSIVPPQPMADRTSISPPPPHGAPTSTATATVQPMPPPQSQGAQSIDAAFDAIDRNHDGVVDREEFRAALIMARQQDAAAAAAAAANAARATADAGATRMQAPAVYPTQGGEQWPTVWAPSAVQASMPAPPPAPATTAASASASMMMGPNQVYMQAFEREYGRLYEPGTAPPSTVLM